MNITEFINGFTNHPVLFVGTGMSLRYLENSFTWDGLLSSICEEVEGNTEFYLDIKSRHEYGGKFRFDEIAKDIEEHFNDKIKLDRDGKFKLINDLFYESMEKGINVSRFKLYIAELLKELKFKSDKFDELIELKKVRKNIGSIITTNYDELIEQVFGFNPLIGNDILLSNPYGSLYKIHGCVKAPTKIIITNEDYSIFNTRYELIRAQLLSLFIHNPIIFIGYNIGDDNIKDILRTIFTYIEPNTAEAEKIRRNFLLIEYEAGSANEEVVEHDIDLEGFSTIRINKIKTDNYLVIYKCLSELHLPISAMDIRKVQSIVKEIYSGGDINVKITEDVDELRNDEKVLVIGSSKTISYEYRTIAELMQQYFVIIEEDNKQILTPIDKMTVQKNQYFPMYGFNKINNSIEKAEDLMIRQLEKIEYLISKLSEICKKRQSSIKDIMQDVSISTSNKTHNIFWNCYHREIDVDELGNYIKIELDKKSTDYRKLLCLYDWLKYAN